MPNLERKRLAGHSNYSGTTIQTGCAVLFGLPFLAVGTFIILVSAGYIQSPEESFHAPRSLVGGVGALFGLAGLWMVGHGLAGYVRMAGVRRRWRERPQEPWYWDHPWNPQGATHGSLWQQVKGFLGLAVFALFLAPFNWIGYATGDFVWMAFVGLFDLLLLGGVGVAVYWFARWIQHGSSRLRFATFPFFLGGSLDAELEDAGKLRKVRSLQVSLRCVQEGFERDGDSNTVVCDQLYEDRQTMTRDSASLSGSELRITFPLPRGDYATRLRERPPRYWELEIKADTPGIDYAATFLLPIYAPPGAR